MPEILFPVMYNNNNNNQTQESYMIEEKECKTSQVFTTQVNELEQNFNNIKQIMSNLNQGSLNSNSSISSLPQSQINSNLLPSLAEQESLSIHNNSINTNTTASCTMSTVSTSDEDTKTNTNSSHSNSNSISISSNSRNSNNNSSNGNESDNDVSMLSPQSVLTTVTPTNTTHPNNQSQNRMSNRCIEDTKTNNNGNHNNSNKNSNHNTNNNSKNDGGSGAYSLRNGRFIKIKKLAPTLQGDLCLYCDKLNHKMIVIKRTNKWLHFYHKGRNDEKVDENIEHESKILYWASGPPDAPIGFVRYIDFMEDNNNYYLAQEYGGSDLFDYVIKQNDLILKGHLSIYEWNRRVQYLVSQICQTVYYFHYHRNLCHLDLSLENTLIGISTNDKTGEIIGVIPRIIDFGLSKVFKKSISCGGAKKCTKFVGKRQYKAPKVWYCQAFDASKADVWSLGVMIFMMILCNPPFEAPDCNYNEFKYVINGRMDLLIKAWKKHHRMPTIALDLLNHMLTYEEKRYSMQQVINHPYIQTAPTFDQLRDKWGYPKNQNQNFKQ